MAEKQLHPERMKLATTARNLFHVWLDAGTEPEQLDDPGYWAHHARTLAQGDRIQVTEERMAWCAEYLVIAVGKVSAELDRLHYKVIDAKVSEPSYQEGSDDCVVEWSGPYSKWRVKRGLEVLQDSLQSRTQANRWVAEYMQARAR